MKKLSAKNSIERLSINEIRNMDALKGGGTGLATHTSKNSTRENLVDKDSQKECLCEDE